jgi:hypothetical protein
MATEATETLHASGKGVDHGLVFSSIYSGFYDQPDTGIRRLRQIWDKTVTSIQVIYIGFWEFLQPLYVEIRQ